MSFPTANPISPYPHHQPVPCNMLPPLRNVPSVAPAASLTLSDCSDLSISSSDNPNYNHHHNHRAFMQYLPPMTHPFQFVHPPPAVPVIPRKPSSPASAPTLSTRAKIAKGPKKIARARSRFPTKAPASRDPNLPPHVYKPAPAKKVRSSKSNIPGESRYWTPSEHKLFVEALLKYGPKDLKAISAYVGTRNMIQCRTHEQKCFMRLMREAQRETFLRNGQDWDAAYGSGKGEDGKSKQQKDVYSVPSSCGITLLCVVGEEMTRSLQS